ncbi:hypothetical protein ACIBHX_04930 [Nonomuraea sp. NPDC050536]|uniref:hypothetical protein n=1 Tax=Nonomuraea sp. NPDC050536 TaxID=3364366 RepID=UPI0037CA78FF
MTRLRTTLAALAEDAPEPTTSLAERAIGITRRRRRTRWIVAPALAAALAVVAVPIIQQQRERATEVTPQVRPLPDHGAGPMTHARMVSCGKDCKRWQLTGRDGREWQVTQALGSYVSKNGGSSAVTAPLALSEDGTHIAYYEASDRRLVVRDLSGGSVRPVRTDGVPPRKEDVGFMGLNLSADGSQLVVAFRDMDLGTGDSHALYVDLATGTSTRLKERCCVRVITRDRVVMGVDTRNKDELVTLGLDGQVISRVAIPRGPKGSTIDSGALSADGRMLARLTDSSRDAFTDRLTTLDVEQGTWTSPVRLALTAMRPVNMKKAQGTMQTVWGWLSPTTVRVDVYPMVVALMDRGQAKELDRLPAGERTVHAYAVDVHTGQSRFLKSYVVSSAVSSELPAARHEADASGISG